MDAGAVNRAQGHLGPPADEYEHRDGLWWYQAPKPRKLHRCTPWTTGWLHYFTLVERCACGAVRLDGRYWSERNSRT